MTNHRHVSVSSTGIPERIVEMQIPHPNAATLEVELSHPMNGHVSHSFWVWQYPEDRRFGSFSARSPQVQIFRALPPGRYFVGPDTRAEPRCRRSVVLGEGRHERVQVDGSSCVVGFGMPYE